MKLILMEVFRKRTRRPRCTAGLVLWATLVPTIGCSREPLPGAHLAGKVTIQGQPVPADAEGRIRFMPTSPGQGPPVETTIQNSRYEIRNVPKGKQRVFFYITRRTGRVILNQTSPDAYPHQEERENLVPPRFQQGVEIEVSADNLQLDFHLGQEPSY